MKSAESALVPSRISSVLTTDSFAIKPEMSAVAHRQSANPRGAKMGARSWPTMARRLSALLSTTFRRVSKLCKNQMTIVARKMTVNARSKKSFAFSQRRRATLLTDGSR